MNWCWMMALFVNCWYYFRGVALVSDSWDVLSLLCRRYSGIFGSMCGLCVYCRYSTSASAFPFLTSGTYLGR